MDNPRRRRPSVPRRDASALDARKVEVLANKLRGLPVLEAPDELWERIEEHLDDDRVTQTPLLRRWSRQVPTAAAASVALIAVAAVLMWVHLATGDIEPASDGESTHGVDEPLDHPALIAALMQQSRQAEEYRRAVLAFYSPSAPERLLRAQIGGIDVALNEQTFAGEFEPKSREALLRDRVDLMADLTDIERYRQHEFVQQVSF